MGTLYATPALAEWDLDKLPLNQWAELPVDSAPSYNYSQPIYVPSRQTVLHWGGVKRSDPRPGARNDVRAFDWKKGDWVSDYPRADKLPGLIDPPYGKGIWYTGKAEMLTEIGTPTPSAVVNAISYDSKRDNVIVTLKGLMAAYDPQTRKWRDMEATTHLSGETSAGGPPVYGAGTCYDPHNDEIVLFPQWGGRNVDRRDETGEVSAHWGTFIYRFQTNEWRRWKETGEPPPRCATPMVYHPQTNAIVMFGGHSGLVRTDLKRMGRDPEPGAWNDTWIYDVTTRRWHDISTDRRPPATRLPNLNYDPDSGLLLSVTRSLRYTKPEDRRITLWALDVKRRGGNAFRGEWFKLSESPWPHDVSRDWFDVTLDPKRRALLLTQSVGAYNEFRHEAYAVRLDLSRLHREPAPQWSPPPPIEPTVIPPDDSSWVEQLQSLPANKWIHVDVERDADTRDWGNAACDPVRGHVYYFGGGHSTYQVNDVAIYVVGANRWVYQAGEHNDWVPPVRWGGVAMGFRGGPHAHHQRNEYVALDGRMYEQFGCTSARWGRRAGIVRAEPYAWYYDLDLGGVWRQRRIENVVLGEGVAGTYAVPHMVDPLRKRVLGFGGELEPYDGRLIRDEAYFATFDVGENRLTIKRLSEDWPRAVYECRPFCFLPDHDQVFFFESRQDRQEWAQQGPPRTWLYDLKTNRFIDQRPDRQPPGDPRTVEYLAGQDAVYAVIGKQGDQQWIYSLKHNAWRQLPLESDRPLGFATPYAQVVYVSRYGVLVNLGHASNGTAVMRPDVSQIDWSNE